MPEILIGCLIPSIFSAFTDAIKRDLYDFITVPIFLLGAMYAAYNHLWGNLIVALVVFTVFFIMAIKGGVSGGDAKFITALAVWFGYPSILYVVIVASITGTIYGVLKLYKMGLFQSRVVTFFRGIYMRIVYGIKGIMPETKLPENDEIAEDAIPYGTFLVIAAWTIYIIL